MLKKTIIFSFLILICTALTVSAQNAALERAKAVRPADFYVSTDGNDANDGSKSAPFATLERARTAVRERMKTSETPLTVEVGAGRYELAQTFTLMKEDSGAAGREVTWRAEPGAEAVLSGGKVLDDWKVVDDPDVLAKLPENVRGKVIQVDLKAVGVSDFGSPAQKGLELFFKGNPMQISRYPNEGFLKITGLVGGHEKDIRGTKGDMYGDFMFDDDRLTAWTDEKDPWVHGYWFWDWSDQRHPVASIGTENKILHVKPPYHSYGYRKGQWFYGFNLLCELDIPGEYYLDRESGILYFYPPEEVTPGALAVTILKNIVKLDQVQFVTWQGFTMEYCRELAFSMSGSDDLCAGCTVRNTGDSGISASGTRQTVFGCHLYQLGASGISVSGGDRKTLTRGDCLIMNNHIHHYGRVRRMYAPGASVSGVGNTISHNCIHDAPHMGMGFSGNDHLIEYNEISNVCFESNDAGAVYTGRNWSMRGNVLQFNYLHDIQGFENRGCVGIYLDDQFSSARMYGNIFVRVRRAAMIGGGRDNAIVNNIYVHCEPCVHLDARGLGWQKDFTQDWIQKLEATGEHLGINIMTPPYSERYPELTTILTNNPGTPTGNVVTHNICVGGNWGGNVSGQWQGTSIWKQAYDFNTIENNFLEGDPLFEDVEHGNFTLRPDSPALKLGIQQIPWQKIGTFEDALRAK